MSMRGSFCTQYMYCQTCAEAVARCVPRWVEYPTHVTVKPSQVRGSRPDRDVILIVAGKMHGTYVGNELVEAEEIADALCEVLCPGHEVEFAVMSDCGAGNAFFKAVGASMQTVRPIAIGGA